MSNGGMPMGGGMPMDNDGSPNDGDQDDMAFVQAIVEKVKAGQMPSPEEIMKVRAILGDAPTEDSAGYWDGGANMQGNRLINMPGANGADPTSVPLGPRVPLHKIM